MKFKYFLLLILVLFTVHISAFQVSKRVFKKVNKELVKTFNVKEIQLEGIVVSDDVNEQLYKEKSIHNLYSVSSGNKLLGYAFIDKAPSKTDEYDYLIVLDKDLIIKKTKILVYREDYGGEIGSRRWLKQFIGKNSTDKLKYQKDIIAISGATISAVSMTHAVNQFLADLAILQNNNIF